MPWSFPGISHPVECTYTQTRGVHPDAALLKVLPQVSNIPATGNLTFTWDGVTAVLRDCVVDKGTLAYTANGVYHLFIVWDRRERWKNAAPISGYYNVSLAGGYVAAKKRSLHALVTLLLTALGETGFTLTNVSTTVFPEVRWLCDPPRILLEQLMQQYGLDLCLGYGSEGVTVQPNGAGSPLPTSNVFQSSITADPRLRPQYVRTCFGKSRMQARFKLECVVRELDGSWVPMGLASYVPSVTWAREDPYTLPNVLAESGQDVWELAVATAFRAYRIKCFTDDSLDLPDGSGTLSDITEVLPLFSHLLSSETVLQEGFAPFRLFGEHYREVHEHGQPARQEITAVDFEISRHRVHFDPEIGLLIADPPLFTLLNGDTDFAEADLYLECSFGVRTATYAPAVYHKDVTFDANGIGYHTIKDEDQYAQVIVSYNSTHAATGSANNQTVLDALATGNANALTEGMEDVLGEVKTYSMPKLAIRLDGAVAQVKHVLTNGEGRDAVNSTTASRFTEFDRSIPGRTQRAAYLQALIQNAEARWRTSERRVESVHER